MNYNTHKNQHKTTANNPQEHSVYHTNVSHTYY